MSTMDNKMPKRELKTAVELAMENTEASAEQVVAEAESTKQNIDQATEKVVADLGADNKDLAEKAQTEAETSKAAVEAVVEVPTSAPVETPIVEAKPEVVSSPKIETKFDIRDARKKGQINKIKQLVEEINSAQDRASKQAALTKAAQVLENPKLLEAVLNHSKDEGEYLFGQAIEDAVAQLEAKITSLENEIRLDQRQRLLLPLRQLIEEINQAVQASSREAKLAALNKAASLLGHPEFASAKLQHSKDEEDLLVPDALEQAVKLAEQMIRDIEAGITTPEEPSVVPKTPEEPPVVPKTPEEPPVVPKTPEEPPVVPKTPEEPPVVELPTGLDDARALYVKALRERRSSINTKKRKSGIGKFTEEAENEFQAIKSNYEKLLNENILAQLQELKSENEEINEAQVNKYVELLDQEEKTMDGLATAADRTRLQKFQSWMNRHAKARLAVGITLAAAGGALAFTGVGALMGTSLFGSGLAIARGPLAGVGTYMGAEAQMATRSEKLGQKGLIDKVAGTGYKLRSDGQKIIKEAIEKRVFDQYSVAELRQEIARLRELRLDKGVALENAGRFGVDQAPLVKHLLEVYYQKLREEILPPKEEEDNKTKTEDGQEGEAVAQATENVEAEASKAEKIAKTLEEHVEANTKASEDAVVSATDKERKKFMTRHAIAAGLGLTVGIFTEIKAVDHYQEVKADHSSTIEEIRSLFPKEETTNPFENTSPDPLKDALASQTENSLSNIAEVHKGDTVWSLAEEQLKQRLGAEEWGKLGEAKQTFLIDAIKDRVAANPLDFGLNHDIDQLSIGEKVDFTSAFKDPSILKELQVQAVQLDQAALENIIHNNEALQEAARHGVHITSENVNDILANVKEHGVSALNPDGSLHETIQTATENIPTGAETVPFGPENIQTGLESTVTTAEQAVEKFMQTPDAHFDGQVFEAAKAAGNLDAVFNKVLEAGNTEQIQNFINVWAENEGLSDNQREIFLGSLVHGDNLELGLNGQVNVGDGLKILEENLKAFNATLLDANAHTTAEAVKAFEDLPKDEWTGVKVGDTYALIRKIVSHKLFLHKLSWVVDLNGDHAADMTISNKDSLTSIIDHKTFGMSVADLEKVSQAVETPEPVAPIVEATSPEVVNVTATTAAPEQVVGDLGSGVERLADFKTPEGATIHFEYGPDGHINHLVTEGRVSGGTDILKPNLMEQIIAQVKDPNRWDFVRTSIEDQARVITLHQNILESMEQAGHGNSAEAIFLKNEIAHDIKKLTDQYGEIFVSEAK